MLSEIPLLSLMHFHPQPQTHPAHIYSKYLLLRPLEFHPRLDGESLCHALLLLRGGELEAGARCRQEYFRGTLGLIRAWIPHKKLVIHNAQAGGESVPETPGLVDNPSTAPARILFNHCHSATGFVTPVCLFDLPTQILGCCPENTAINPCERLSASAIGFGEI